MDDREWWRERVKDIHADRVTWWWLAITNEFISLELAHTSKFLLSLEKNAIYKYNCE